MLDFIDEKKSCTGCGACISVCPVKCISMNIDEEGFQYPFASDKCVHCGMCKKICPQRLGNDIVGKVNIEQQAYAGRIKNKEKWLNSSSGGAFSAICESWGRNDSVIYGAGWDKNRVKHIKVIGPENIKPLCKSKYIASEVGMIYTDILCELEEGKKVLFSGTPCQVAGLRRFLGKEYDNLLLVDFICHGVGSPTVFAECLKYMEDKLGIKIKKYEFRSKRGCFETDYLSKIVLEDNEEKYLINDPYSCLFLKQDCLRPCCGKNCKYRNSNRQSDITIADFKKIENVFPELIGTKYNYSSIVVNTQKGLEILTNGLDKKMELHKCSLDDVEKYNPLFYRQTVFSASRDEFFYEFNKSPITAISAYSYEWIIYKKSLKRKIFDLLPTSIRKMIINGRRRIKIG